MTKYSESLKLKVIDLYFNQQLSMTQISKSMNVGYSSVKDWIHIYDLHGAKGLQDKQNHTVYSVEFKVMVLNRVVQEKNSIKRTARIFNIQSSMIYKWRRDFDKHGILGLENKSKGRPNTLPKKPVKKAAPKRELTENEQLKEENLKLKEELEKKEIELDITKKWVALTHPELTKEKWWRP